MHESLHRKILYLHTLPPSLSLFFLSSSSLTALSHIFIAHVYLDCRSGWLLA
jgi:hypothetical protein